MCVKPRRSNVPSRFDWIHRFSTYPLQACLISKGPLLPAHSPGRSKTFPNNTSYIFYFAMSSQGCFICVANSVIDKEVLKNN